MNLMTPIAITKHYSVCPTCKTQCSTIDHLLNTDCDTHWYCNECGQGYSISFKKSGDVFTQASNKRFDKTIVLLKYENIGLLVQGNKWSEDGVKDYSGDQSFYNESTCPTNYLQNVIAIVDLADGDTDPHGIFEYVTTLDWVQDVDECNFDLTDIVKVFYRRFPLVKL